jgi:hypothetical protein
MNAVGSGVAVCDPRIIVGAILSDEAAYRAKNVEVRVISDPATFPILTQAALLFDTILADPIIMGGLKPILGHGFFELFGDTLKKAQASGFIAFNPVDYIPKDKRDRLKRLQNFLSDVNTTEREVGAVAGEPTDIFAATVDNAMLYSKLGSLPFVGANGGVRAPTLPTQQSVSTDLLPFTVLTEILSVELPLLQVTTLDDILEIRATKGATEFRQIIRQLVTSLRTELLEEAGDPARILKMWTQVKNEAVDLLITEFRSEVQGWSPTKAAFSVLLDIGGFIPGVSIVTGSMAAAKDTAELLSVLAKRKKLKDLGFLCFLAEVRSKHSEAPHE